MSFKSFPSIGQLSNFVTDFKKSFNRGGDREENKNIGFKFVGSVKLHGTNSAVGLSEKDGLWVQSRNRVITPQSDNYDFAAYVYDRKTEFEALLREVAIFFKIDLSSTYVLVYGEWCGGRIQNRVAIRDLPKMFVMFDVSSGKNGKNENDEKGENDEKNENAVSDETQNWYDVASFPQLRNEKISVYNIGQFQRYEISFSLNSVSSVKAQLIKYTEEVENECPVGKYFGRSKEKGDCTTGEGIVWRAEINGKVYRFKVKGDEHATSKVTKLTTGTVISPNLEAFIEASVTENRLEQGLSEIFRGEELTKESFKRLGEFQSWVVKDVKKEDLDGYPYLSEYNGEKGEKEKKRVEKELNKAISEKSRSWFQKKVFMG